MIENNKRASAFVFVQYTEYTQRERCVYSIHAIAQIVMLLLRDRWRQANNSSNWMNWIEIVLCMYVISPYLSHTLSFSLSHIQLVYRKMTNLFSALHSIVCLRVFISFLSIDFAIILICICMCVCVCMQPYVSVSVNTFFFVLPFAVFGLVSHSYV